MYRDTSSVDCAPRELTHACSRSDTEDCDMCYVFNVNLTDSFDDRRSQCRLIEYKEYRAILECNECSLLIIL